MIHGGHAPPYTKQGAETPFCLSPCFFFSPDVGVTAARQKLRSHALRSSIIST